MAKKIHINSKMFLSAPYIVRVEHGEFNGLNMDLVEFYKILRKTRSTTFATWGYSHPSPESISLGLEDPAADWISKLCHNNSVNLLRSYWVFEDDSDALQFRLGLSRKALQVFMWPKDKQFTMYEYTSYQQSHE